MTSPLQKIVIADDHDNIRTVLKHQLGSAGYSVSEARTGEEALATIDGSTSVAIVDLEMPHLNGFEILQRTRNQWPNLPVILLSTNGSMGDALRAIQAGAFWCLEKPFEREELLEVVGRAVDTHGDTSKSENASRQVESDYPDIVAESPAMRALLQKIERLSALDSTVLLTGESGTGKSTLAKLIHGTRLSLSRPFVSLSCAAFPRELLEGELFGSERGAYTGSVASRAGCIEVAQNGTLFLDEIGDLPLDLQPKLLTFLQEHTYRRLGSTKERSSNARIICATNIDLAELCRVKLFREELYYRINVLALKVPALRERREDIRGLSERILARISTKRGDRRSYSLTPGALRALEAHQWPGNVRELENLLERATAFSETDLITESDLSFDTQSRSAKEDVSKGALSDTQLTSPQQAGTHAGSGLAGLTLEQIETRAVMETLDFCKGNKVEAAKLLGISLKSIYNKLSRAS